MEAGNYKDALSLLEKSLKMNRQIMGDGHESNAQIYMVMGQVYLRQKHYEMALDAMQQALKIMEDTFGPESEQVANCHLELAQVYFRSRQYE